MNQTRWCTNCTRTVNSQGIQCALTPGEELQCQLNDRSEWVGTTFCTCSVCKQFKVGGLTPEEGEMTKENISESLDDRFEDEGPESKKDKPPIADLLRDFNLAIVELSRVTAFGCHKHGVLGGWRGMNDFEHVYQNAKSRHAISGLIQDRDGESGLYHLAHEAWNALALMQWKLEGLTPPD